MPKDSQEYFSLPPHRRCACHKLNLMTTTDVSKISDQHFKTLLRNVNAKMRTVWKKQSGSPKASDFITKMLGGLFVLPVQTRWNSFYDALVRVKKYLATKPEEFKDIFFEFKCPVLRPAEEEFIFEYVRVMRPVADALDMLQADKHMTIGYLLPTLYVLKQKLKKMEDKGNLKHCEPLVKCLISSINKRFAEDFFDRDLRIAAISHPSFKLSWVPDDEKETLENIFRDAVSDLKESLDRSNGQGSITNK